MNPPMLRQSAIVTPAQATADNGREKSQAMKETAPRTRWNSPMAILTIAAIILGAVYWFGDKIDNADAHVQETLNTKIGEVKTDMHREVAGVKADMQREVAGAKAEIHREVAGVKTDMHREFGEVRADIAAVEAKLDEVLALIRQQ